MTAAKAPTVPVHGGQLPVIGLGCFQAKKGGEVGNALRYAIEHAGYRHIDTASSYENEDEIGDVLTDLFKNNIVKREDLFVTSKLNNPYHHREHVKPALLKTLKDLNLDYVDLYLMHWPIAFQYVPYDPEKRGFDKDYNQYSPVDRTVSIRETWEAIEELYHEGLVKTIGISNFTVGLIHDLLTYAKVKPAVLQIELHPYLQQSKLLKYCQMEGIVVEAYSPLGSGAFKKAEEPSVLSDPTLIEIGKKYNKSSAQIALRWAVERGTVPLPKSVTPERIQSNIDVFDFELSEDDIKEIKKLDKNYRFFRPQDWYGISLFH